MAAPQPASESQPRTAQTKKTFLPNGSEEILFKSLQVGAGTGAFGALVGASTGIAIGTRFPVLFTLVYSLQWFAQGSIYYGTRHMILSRHGPVNTATPRQKLEASSLGGAISGGTVVGLMRGPRAVLPATVIGTLLGGGLQFGLNMWDNSRKSEEKSDSWWNSKWSPMKKLTDQEYENILEEKLLRLDAEIAIIDDNIAVLKAEIKGQAKSTNESPEASSNKRQT